MAPESPIEVTPGNPAPVIAPKYDRRAWAAAFLSALLLIRIAAAALRFSFIVPMSLDLSFPEGAVVARAADVAMGRPAYPDWREWPHHFAPYAPLTYYPVGWIARLAFADPSPQRIYVLGRLQSGLSLAGIVCLIYMFVVRRFKLAMTWGLLACALFVAWVRMLEFVLSYRPDAPAALLSLVSLWLVTGGAAKGPRAGAAVGALWLSFWFKPTSWGMMAVLGWWVGATGGVKRAVLWCCGSIGLGLLGAFALDRIWDGRLALNMIGSLDNGYKLSNLPAFYSHVPWIAGMVFLGGLATLLWKQREGRTDIYGALDPSRIFAAAILITFIAVSFQNLKVGADINYYLELYALCSVACAWGLASMWNRKAGSRALRVGVILFAGVALGSDAWAEFSSLSANLRIYREHAEPPPMARLLSERAGLVLCPNPYFVLLRPAPPTILDHVQYQILVQRGRLGDEGLIDRVGRREFEAIALYSTVFEPREDGAPGPREIYSPRFVPELMENYREVRRRGGHVLFERRPRRASP